MTEKRVRKIAAAGKPVRGEPRIKPRAGSLEPSLSGKAPPSPVGKSRQAHGSTGSLRTESNSSKTPRALRPDEVRELFSRLAELNPNPTTELAYSTPFELLVAVILSAQATDVGVNKAMRRLYPVANTPAAIIALAKKD